MATNSSTTLAESTILEAATWPAASMLSPEQSRTILGGIVLSNKADLFSPGRVKKGTVDVLSQAMLTDAWSPEDHAPSLWRVSTGLSGWKMGNTASRLSSHAIGPCVS